MRAIPETVAEKRKTTPTDGQWHRTSAEGRAVSSIHDAKMRTLPKVILLGTILLGIYFMSFAKGAEEEFPVAPPPMPEGIFPCSSCHASLEVNRKRRELKEEHTQIKLHHAENLRWCLDCHNANNRDKLRLYNGELISFTASYRLCGECHGNVYRDWKAGIPGKRTGYFSGG